ncbi:hypothetical protein Nepgr_022908 [Nepenthes gracilis]|uniref:Uncharacterized protein n=1 Tax=Nepenthes gracilis TaxID=150966 RepID=A0AAD3T3E4_NEPGR|nr:hypothetical protein Nepgr_022908 [Nepenthes gracilis]
MMEIVDDGCADREGAVLLFFITHLDEYGATFYMLVFGCLARDPLRLSVFFGGSLRLELPADVAAAGITNLVFEVSLGLNHLELKGCGCFEAIGSNFEPCWWLVVSCMMWEFHLCPPGLLRLCCGNLEWLVGCSDPPRPCVSTNLGDIYSTHYGCFLADPDPGWICGSRFLLLVFLLFASAPDGLEALKMVLVEGESSVSASGLVRAAKELESRAVMTIDPEVSGLLTESLRLSPSRLLVLEGSLQANDLFPSTRIGSLTANEMKLAFEGFGVGIGPDV